MRSCLQDSFDCRTRGYDDPWWRKLGGNDHTGASSLPGAECEEIKDVDENCVNKMLDIGSYQGPFGPINCQNVTKDILDSCSTKPKPNGLKGINPAGPSGVY